MSIHKSDAGSSHSQDPSSLTPSPSRLQSRFAVQATSDENLDLLSHVLDDFLRIPGTSIRFGLDAVIGLVPGVGDLLVGLLSCILPVVAWMRGVPYVTLVRMIVNLLLDVLIGAVPFIGDAFHVAWKANRRNYALMTRHLQEPQRHTWKDRIFLSLLAVAVIAVLASPIVIALWLLMLMRKHF